ncbi:MAG: hypothetical protein JRC53_05375 [Deltaproteobacteria bacterium]|nr:hypothetical protein [Deltaproteobacteria bacterium]
MRLCVQETRGRTGSGIVYPRIRVWTTTEPVRWREFSSNKARLVCELLSNHGKVKLWFVDSFYAEVVNEEVEVSNKLMDILDALSRIKRNFTRPIYDKLSRVTDDLDKFKEELAPFILELELEDSERG